MSAQPALRHASADLTLGTYMQSSPESVRAPVELLDANLTKSASESVH